jgi:hypothetical protein
MEIPSRPWSAEGRKRVSIAQGAGGKNGTLGCTFEAKKGISAIDVNVKGKITSVFGDATRKRKTQNHM